MPTLYTRKTNKKKQSINAHKLDKKKYTFKLLGKKSTFCSGGDIA